MSNAFNDYTAQQVAEVALAHVKYGSRLATVVAKFGPDRFREGRGATVFLNVPGALTAHARALGDTSTAIILDSLTESQEPVKLDVHAYSAVALSEHDLSLGLQDFNTQVLKPQMDAVIDKIESSIEAVLAGVAEDASITYNAADPLKLFTAGRAALRAKGIDVAEEKLVAIVGSNVVDDLLDSGVLDLGKTGDASAIREGSLGRIRGFETIESGRVGADEVVFMTGEAIYLAHRAPTTPAGASFGQTVTGEGLSLRYLRDYDPSHTAERSLVSTFVGAGVMPLYKVQRTQDTGKQGDAGYDPGSASIVGVPGGAVVKVNVAA